MFSPSQVQHEQRHIQSSTILIHANAQDWRRPRGRKMITITRPPLVAPEALILDRFLVWSLKQISASDLANVDAELHLTGHKVGLQGQNACTVVEDLVELVGSRLIPGAVEKTDCLQSGVLVQSLP